MQVANGIPIPDEIEVDDYICVTVYVPNDTDGYYIQAMAGALSQMGKWSYWEKDTLKRGARVAEIWREHIDLTYDEAWLQGVFMTCTQIELLVDAINNQADTISQAIRTLELTIAPIDCIDCADRVYVPPSPIPDPDPDNPPDQSTPAEWQAYLCRATNYLWYEHVQRGGVEMVFLASTGQTIIGVGAIIAILYASGIGAPIAFAATILATILALASTWDRTSFEAELERLAEPVICAIFSSTGTDSALAAMRQTLVDEGADQDTIDYIMSATGSSALNKLFNAEIVVPDEFIAPVICADCGYEMPPLPTGWRWEKNMISSTEVVSAGGTSVVTPTYQGHTLHVEGDAGSAPNSSGFVVQALYDTNDQSEQYMGMLIDMNSEPMFLANAGGWIQGDYILQGSATKTEQMSPLSQGTVQVKFYGVNVNGGTPEAVVMQAIMDSVDGHTFIGNPSSVKKYNIDLAYYKTWSTVNANITMKTWSLFWDGTT